MQIWDELRASEILKESVELFQECFISALKLRKEKLGTGLNVSETEWNIIFFLDHRKYSKEDSLKTNAFWGGGDIFGFRSVSKQDDSFILFVST